MKVFLLLLVSLLYFSRAAATELAVQEFSEVFTRPTEAGNQFGDPAFRLVMQGYVIDDLDAPLQILDADLKAENDAQINVFQVALSGNVKTRREIAGYDLGIIIFDPASRTIVPYSLQMPFPFPADLTYSFSTGSIWRIGSTEQGTKATLFFVYIAQVQFPDNSVWTFDQQELSETFEVFGIVYTPELLIE